MPAPHVFFQTGSQHLDELDSLMRRGPGGFTPGVGVSPAAFANYTIARLRQKQGDR